MKTSEQLREYLRDLVHTDDVSLCDDIRALLTGDDTRRDSVERALDQIDRDVSKYESRLHP